jgi:hypothetical protein
MGHCLFQYHHHHHHAHKQIWNTHTLPNPNLGELGERLPVYSLLDYERDAGVGVAGCVHIETVRPSVRAETNGGRTRTKPLIGCWP